MRVGAFSQTLRGVLEFAVVATPQYGGGVVRHEEASWTKATSRVEWVMEASS